MAREFTERHARKGLMTNMSQAADGYRRDLPHASTIVCEREECQAAARFWVQGVTGEGAVYIPDARGERP